MPLRSYAYVSRVTVKEDEFPSAVDDIIKRAVACNAERDITGVLVSSRGFFSQLVEGPPGPLATLIDELHQDERHSQIRVFEDIEVGQRRTPGWALAYSGAPTFLGNMLAGVHSEEIAPADANRLVRLLLQFARPA